MAVNKKSISDKIMALRDERGWSNNRLAIEANVSHSTVNAWFSRSTMPSLEAIIYLCENAFGITLSEFFNETDSRLELVPAQVKLLDEWDLLFDDEKKKFLELFAVMNGKRKETR